MKTKQTKTLKILFEALLILTFLTLVSCDNDKSKVAVKPPKIDIHMAIISDDIDAINQHILAGTDINKKDPFGGSSPLISAALFDKKEIVEILIHAGADINFKNNDGSTPLQTAAFFCRTEIVKFLLEKGADKTIRNNMGVTAYESVTGAFKDVKPIYDIVGQSLAPMGLHLDYDDLKLNRPKIADILK